MTPTNINLQEDAVFLIDGSGYIFRAYYAVRPLKTSKGVPTNAVYGFTSMLMKLLREHKPRHVAIAFDTKAPTFRHKMYAEYKAHRPPPPEDLIPQFALIHQVCDALQIKKLIVPGFEADDLIGTLAKQAHEQGRQVVIVTGDKDFMQLVNGDIFLLDELRASKMGSEFFIDRTEVIKKFGVPPEQVIDVLALMGDASDNVPGVAGIGEKTAIELVKQYGPLETILNCAPTMSQKGRRENLINGADLARLSKKLVTIDCHAPVGIEIKDLVYPGPSREKIVELFKELEFRRQLEDPLFAPAVGQDSRDKPKDDKEISHAKYRAITTLAQLETLAALLKSAPRIAVDTETDSLNSLQSHLVGISLCYAPGEAVYIPIGHKADIVPEQIPLAHVREILNPIFIDSNRMMIAQNAKFDIEVLVHAGFAPFKIGADPMLADYLLHADSTRHSLDDMSRRYLGHDPISYEEVCGKGKAQISFDQVPLAQALGYSAEDAEVAFRLAAVLELDLRTEQLDGLYRDMELPLAEVLCRMEQAGIQIDTVLLQKMSTEFESKLQALEKDAHQMAGSEFNLASPKQVGDILFEKLQLARGKKTKTGSSTDSSVLEDLIHEHPLPRLLLEHRMIAKLKGTYVDALPKLINPETGRVHTSFNQAVAATGRLSSSDPNLQNIPIRTPEGRRIREAFIAKDGCVLISLDYSQIELRILAAISGDPVMLDAFQKGEDIHARTASEIFSVPLSSVTKDLRNQAKTINFGLIYGMGVMRLSQTLGISRADASSYLNKYYERYAGVYEWQKHTLETAKKEQEVRTLFGRRRKLPEIASHNRGLAQRAERMATNTPIQGAAADIIKKAMIIVDAELSKKFPASRMLLQVHDELLIESPIAEAASVEKLVKDIMTDVKEINVPVLVESGIGHSWANAH